MRVHRAIACQLGLLVALSAGLVACASSAPPARPAFNPGYASPGYAAPGYAGAPGAPSPWGAFPPPAPLLFERPVNLSALLALQGRPCAPKEVAPGTWIRFDCGLHQLVTRAIAYLPLPKQSFVSGPLPFSVDHRAEGSEGPIKSQGMVGACTAFSLSTAMDNAVRRMGRGDVISPLHVWSKYAVPVMGTAGDQTLDKNITVEPSWPYDPVKACKLSRDPGDDCSAAYGVVAGSASMDPQLRAEQGAADVGGRYRLTAVERLTARPASTDELAAVLAGGDDVWASFEVNDQAWMQRSLQSSTIPDYTVNDSSGHAVVLAGYRTLPTGQRQFLVHNSWGQRWGEQGYGWISDNMVRAYMRSAYKVRVTDAAAPGVPVPGGGGGGADGCPAGQVKDAVLGTCAALCASGSAPAAGVCLPTVPGFPAPGQPAPGQPAPGQPVPGGLPFPLPFPFPAPGQPAPGQSPATTCPQGQAADLMTGACAPLCPNGAPTMGGMCLRVGP
jgi:hypothetical protein